MENLLNTLLENYMDNVESIIAAAIVDRNGLIITSRKRERADEDSDTVIGAVSAVLEGYIERLQNEFQTESTFFNITSTGDKKFAFCSQGKSSILATIAEPRASDTELKVFSEHIAGKIKLLIEGEENVNLNIPRLIKTLSQTRSGTLPEGEFSAKVILTGDGRVGKTSLVRRFVENRFKDEYINTLGVDISKHSIEIGENSRISFIIWDIGGQNFSPYRDKFYNGANCAFLVLDRTREKTLDGIRRWHTDISQAIKRDIAMIIVGNKSDLVDQIEVEEEDIKKLADELGFNYILTSAKTGENVKDAFTFLGYEFLENL
ncbi:MAG: GTP-binding protein [Promethearchaeota archaeon]|nr:MAG: GTP-binding protein [Candidatus Lokiarchaeota archaeon]